MVKEKEVRIVTVHDLLKKKNVASFLLALDYHEYKGYKEIKKKTKISDTEYGRCLRSLLFYKIIIKKDKQYKKSKSFRDILDGLIHKYSDTMKILNYDEENIITRPKTSIYGLSKSIFDPRSVNSPSHNEFTPEYTRLHFEGINLNKILGMEKEGSPKVNVDPFKLLDTVTSQLLEIKKEYRMSELKRFLNANIALADKEINPFVVEHSTPLLQMINNSDWDINNKKEGVNQIDEALTNCRGMGWKKIKSNYVELCYGLTLEKPFYSSLIHLNKIQKTKIADFLWLAVESQKHLYPTGILIVSKTSSFQIIDNYSLDIIKEMKNQSEEPINKKGKIKPKDTTFSFFKHFLQTKKSLPDST